VCSCSSYHGILVRGGTACFDALPACLASCLCPPIRILLSPACSLCRDYPNAWPPLNHMIIEGLATSIGDPRAPALASDLAVRYLRNAYTTYYATGGLMSEKLDAAQPGTPGGGGEYKPQVRAAVRLHVCFVSLRKIAEMPLWCSRGLSCTLSCWLGLTPARHMPDELLRT
jgi:hypothetical protein